MYHITITEYGCIVHMSLVTMGRDHGFTGEQTRARETCRGSPGRGRSCPVLISASLAHARIRRERFRYTVLTIEVNKLVYFTFTSVTTRYVQYMNVRTEEEVGLKKTESHLLYIPKTTECPPSSKNLNHKNPSTSPLPNQQTP